MKYNRVEDVSILDTLSSLGIEIKDIKRGKGTISICCPLHDDSNPSFTIYENTNSFYCFGCGIGGTVKDLVRRVLNASNEDAVKYLESKFEIDYDAIPTVEDFADSKGLDIGLLYELGWENVANGIKIPYQGFLPEDTAKRWHNIQSKNGVHREIF